MCDLVDCQISRATICYGGFCRFIYFFITRTVRGTLLNINKINIIGRQNIVFLFFTLFFSSINCAERQCGAGYNAIFGATNDTFAVAN